MSTQDKIKQIKRYYLFYGPNDYKLDERVASLVKAVIAPGAEAFDLDWLDGKTADSHQIINAISTPPAISPLRIVVLANSERLGANDQNMLEAFLSKIPEYSVLAMVAAKVDRRSKLFKRLASEAKKKPTDDKDVHTYFYDHYSALEAQALIEKFAGDRGKKISLSAASSLVEMFGADAFRLQNEIEKLSLYTGDATEIGKRDLAFASGFDRVETVDDLTDLIVSDKPGEALSLIMRAMASGISEFQILFILKSFLLGLNLAIAFGNVGKIMSSVRMDPNRARDLLVKSRGITQEAVAKGLVYIFRAEFSLKSARFPGDIIMELLIMSLCLILKGNIQKSRVYQI